MKCRLVQDPGGEVIHPAWCRTGQVFAALDAIEKTETIDPDDDPGTEPSRGETRKFLP